MKSIAVIADIQSNIFALKAVWESIQSKGIEQVINLGDILYGPVAPDAVYDFLKEKECITILGNQDRILFGANENNLFSNPTLKLVLNEIGKEGLNWIKGIPATKKLDEIFLCHGSPKSDMHYLLEDVSSGRAVLRLEDEIEQELEEVAEEVVLCAHTHIPRTVNLANGKMVLNPGSVGLQAYDDDLPNFHKMETGSPHARYAILSKNAEGWETDHLQVLYDFEAAAKLAEKNGRQDWANYIRTGRA